MLDRVDNDELQGTCGGIPLCRTSVQVAVALLKSENSPGIIARTRQAGHCWNCKIFLKRVLILTNILAAATKIPCFSSEEYKMLYPVMMTLPYT